MDTNELIQENRHLRDQLANLSKTHAEDMIRLSDMIDRRIKVLRDLTESATESWLDCETSPAKRRHQPTTPGWREWEAARDILGEND